MKKLFLIIILQFSLFTLNYSQEGWFWQNPRISGNDYKAVYFVNKDTGWVCGSSGEILFTTDNGLTWTSQYCGINGWFNSAFFVNEITGWIAGNDGIIIKTTNQGKSWLKQTTNTSNHIINIFFVSDNVGWAVGAKGLILKTTNGGDDWLQQLSGVSETFYGLFFLNENEGWITYSTGKILHTKNGGISWEIIDTFGKSYSASIHFFNPDTGLVLDGNNILRTTDAGKNWATSSISGMYYWPNFMDICFTSDSTGYAAGGGEVVKTTNGGISWKEVFRDVSFEALSFSNDSTGFGVGSGGMIYNTNDGGTNWNKISPFEVTKESLISVFALSPEVAIAGGYDGEIVKTTDSGLNWRKMHSPNDHYVKSIFMLNPLIGWACCGEATLYKTTDGGENWSQCLVGCCYPYADISFTNENIGFMLYKEPGESTFMKSTDGGNKWSNLITFNDENYWTLYAVNTDTIYIAGDKIKKTTDGGNNWDTKLNSTAGIIRDILFFTPAEGWAVGDNGVIYHSSDFGNTWILQSNGTSVNLTSIECKSKNRIWVSGYGGTILFSSNGGNTWEKQISHYYGKVWSVSFANNNIGWAVGDNGTILKTIDGGIVIPNIETLSSAPNLLLPLNGAQSVSCNPILTWDNLKNADSYQIQVSNDSTFSSMLIDSSSINGLSLQIKNLSYNTFYYWRLRGMNEYSISPWTKYRYFKTESEILLAPVLSFPADGATEISNSTNLKWYRTSNTDSYKLQVGLDSLFSTKLMDSTGIRDTIFVLNKLTSNTKYFWRVAGLSQSTVSDWTEVWKFSTAKTTGVNSEDNIPKEFTLKQNYPNPFNPSTIISYQLAVNSKVSLKIFNTLGQEVETLVDEYQIAGFHSSLFTINSSLPSGIYYYQLKAENFIDTKKFVVVK